MEEIKTLEEGIYFKLDESIYHANHAFSCSGAKKILISELNFWHSTINPEKEPEKETPAKEYGKAAHRYILEPNTFEDVYCFVPDEAPNRPNKRQLEAKKPSADTLKAIEWWDNFNLVNMGKKVADRDWLVDFRNAEKMMQKYEGVKDCFKGGYPEVSIFLKIDGIMHKIRMDYLKIKGIDDFKTFSNSGNRPIEEAIFSSISIYKYNLQYYFYVFVLEEAKKRLKAGTLQSFNCPNPEFLQMLANYPTIDFNLIFQESDAPYEVRKVEMFKALKEGATPNQYWKNAEEMYFKAIEKYKNCWKKYGSEPWISDNAVITLTDELIPSMMYQQF